MWSGDGGEGGGNGGWGARRPRRPFPRDPRARTVSVCRGCAGGTATSAGSQRVAAAFAPFPFYPPPAILPERDEGSVAMRVPVQPWDGKVAEPRAGSGRAGGGGAGAEGGRRRTRRRRRQRGESERGREGALGAADVAAPRTLPRDFRPQPPGAEPGPEPAGRAGSGLGRARR